MDLLKSLIGDSSQDTMKSEADGPKQGDVSSNSSSSLSSSSSETSYESSVSASTKQTAQDTQETPRDNRPAQKEGEADKDKKSDIDDDFYGTGFQEKPKSVEATINGEGPVHNPNSGDEGAVQENGKNGTSTFNFTFSSEQNDSEKRNTDSEDDEKQTDRVKKGRRRPRTASKTKTRQRRAHASPTKHPASPRGDERKGHHEKRDDLELSPWDYGEDDTKRTTTNKQSKHRQRKKPRSPRAQVDYQQLEEERQRVLQTKYEELRELLAKDPWNKNQEIDPELLQQSKQILRRYKRAQKSIPKGAVIAPPSGAPPVGHRRRQFFVEPEDVAQNHTQAVAGSENGALSPHGTDDTVYIDLTESGGSMKHVTFANGHRVETEGRIPVEARPPPPEQKTEEPNRGREQRNRARRPRSGKRVSRKLSVTSSERSASPQHKDKTGSGSREASPSSSSSPSPGRRRYTSESSESESTSRSRSRSTEKPFVPSDHNLKNSKNPRIVKWLRQKNKLLRKQRAEERKKERAKRKEEEAKLREKAARQAESEDKVRRWMEQKGTEARLLQKRERLENARKLKFDDTVVISNTVDFKDGAGAVCSNGVSEDGETKLEINNNCEKHGKHCDKNGQEETITLRVNMKGEETLKCTCGFVETIKMKEEEERQRKQVAASKRPRWRKVNHPDYSIRRRPNSAKRASRSPARSKKGKVATPKTDGHQSDSNQNADKSRMSYDEWLRVKRKQDIRKQRGEHNKLVKQMSKSDPEIDRVISEVGRKRVEQIRDGKKTIDTGVASVDEAANAYPETRTAEEEPGEGDPKPEVHSWRLDGEAKPQRPSTARATSQNSARPASSRRRPASAPKGDRPASSRQFFRAPVPPRPSKSPAPPGQSSEGVVFPTSPRRRAKSPKPDVVTSAYEKVRHEQGSWDEFSDYVWDKINEEEGAEMKDEEKPESSDKVDDDVNAQNNGDTEDARETKEEKEDEKREGIELREDEEGCLEKREVVETQAEGDRKEKGDYNCHHEKEEEEKEGYEQGESEEEGEVGGEEKDSEQEEEEQKQQHPEADEEDTDEDADNGAKDEAESPTNDDSTTRQDKTEEPESDENNVDTPTDTFTENKGGPQEDEDCSANTKQSSVPTSLQETPEIVIDGPTEDSVESDESSSHEDAEASQPAEEVRVEPLTSIRSDGDGEEEKAEQEADQQLPSDGSKTDEDGVKPTEEDVDAEDRHTPCILEITEEAKTAETKHEKHVTFLTSNED